MKKHYAYILSTSLLIISSGLSAMVKDPLRVEFELVRSGVSSGHNDAFGGGPQKGGNIFSQPINSQMWDNSLSVMKRFITKIIDQNKNLLGSLFNKSDQILSSTLNTVVRAGGGVANHMKSIQNKLRNQEIFSIAGNMGNLKDIENSMRAVQIELQPYFSPMPTQPKEFAYNLLYTTAIFIEETAKKALRDASAKLRAITP
jgi:hypothetical protein